eukprot:1997292-Prymnesium_polylepis.1
MYNSTKTAPPIGGAGQYLQTMLIYLQNVQFNENLSTDRGRWPISSDMPGPRAATLANSIVRLEQVLQNSKASDSQAAQLEILHEIV